MVQLHHACPLTLLLSSTLGDGVKKESLPMPSFVEIQFGFVFTIQRLWLGDEDTSKYVTMAIRYVNHLPN